MAVGKMTVSDGANAYVTLLDPSRKWLFTATYGYDGSMVHGLQSLPQWEKYFHHPTKGNLPGNKVGALAGYPFAPYLSDGIGRKPTIFLGAFIMVVGTVIETASQSVAMLIGARFLVGFGLSFATPMLVAELSYPKHRAFLTSTYNSLWYSGALVAAWTTFGTFKINMWAWRIPSALLAVPSVLRVLLWFVPESSRYLVSKANEAQALHILAYYHADGNADDPLVQHEFKAIKSAVELDVAGAPRIIETSGNVGWTSFLSSSGNLAIAFFSQWSGNGLVSFYLNKVLTAMGIMDATTQLLINGIALSLQTICFARFRITGNQGAAHASFSCSILRSSDLAFSPLIITYTLEILPYNIRAKGFNIFNFTISLALIFNQYVNAIASIIIETKARTLEQTAAIFDGVAEHIVGSQAEHAEVTHDVGGHEKGSDRDVRNDEILLEQ
ncbi:hexose transporter [Mycena vitilis]|nr:hexose transporter [Mycena vitilis]